LWYGVLLNGGPNCTAKRVAVLCIGLWYRVLLNDGPNCTAERVAVLCIGLWYRVLLNGGPNCRFVSGAHSLNRLLDCKFIQDDINQT
jgi:hypothetical protein